MLAQLEFTGAAEPHAQITPRQATEASGSALVMLSCWAVIDALCKTQGVAMRPAQKDL